MSMLKICGQELELDLFDADTMEVYEKSMDKVVKRAEETKKHTELGKNNLAICMDAFGIVSSEAGKMKGQVNAITNKYNMNRAQRRQEGKKNKHGKNGAVVTPIGNASGRDNS